MNLQNDFSRKLILGLVQGKDIAFLARHLAQHLNRPVIITNEVHRVLVFQDPLDRGIQVEEFFPVPPVTLNEEDLYDHNYDLFSPGQLSVSQQGYPYVYLPLQAAGRCLGYCIVFASTSTTEPGLPQQLSIREQGQIRQTALAFLLTLRNKWEYERGQEQLRDEFIRDILYNNYDSKASIYEKAKLWKWDLQGALVVLVIDCRPEKIGVVREIVPDLFNFQRSLSARINNQLVIILNVKDLEKAKLRATLQKFLDKLISRCQDYELGQFGIGIGSRVAAVTDLYKSYQEAKVAWELGKVFVQGPICYFEEMGFLKFIFTQPAMELQEFSQRILDSLLDYDLETESDLLDTLRTFIDNNLQIAESAKALYVHENTLRNRIKKIEHLTGFDLRRVDHLINLYIALQVFNSGKDS